jgi:enoyl-CoA hydratase/carnithine racemase
MPTQIPSTPGLRVDEDAHAVVLRIHNPDRANAVDDDILAAIVRRVAHPRPEVRAIVLTGSGDRHFSAGLDLGDLEGPALADRLRGGERLLGEATAAIAACPCPVLAAINGAAFGGALELAVACDWRIASDGARLGMPAARLGVVYSPQGLARFVALLGPARTRQLFLTGRPVTAQRAMQIGLVDQVVPAGELSSCAREAVDDIIGAAPIAVAGTRAAITMLEGAPSAEIAQAIEHLRDAAYGSPQFHEGLAAFRERRAARWESSLRATPEGSPTEESG